MLSSPLRAFAFRLPPGVDLKRELLAVAVAHDWPAAAVVSCVGSLSAYCLRFADRRESVTRVAPFEIVSLVGTLSASGCHLHIGLADADGVTVGGHVLEGCLVRTTAELVVAELPALAFHREPDPATGYSELVVARATR